MKKISVLVLSFFIFSLIGSESASNSAEAATVTNPSNRELLIFSHLVYDPIDGAGAQTGKTIKDIMTSSSYQKVTSGFRNDLKGLGIDIKKLISDEGLHEWYIYNFLDKNDDAAGAKKTGFFGVIFKNKVTGKYAVAIRGTNNMNDVYTDIALASTNGEIKQINYARKLFAKLPAKTKAEDITVTGHSLGGYIAARMGAGRNYKTVTFNAPGYQADYLKALRKSGASKYEEQITNYNIQSDYVSGSGTQIGSVKVFPKKWNWGYKKIHSIITFYQFIE